MAGLFTDWGQKNPEASGGITIESPKRKEIRRIKKGKRFVGESVGGVSYDKRIKVKPESAGSISYGSRTKAQTTGGISYRPRQATKEKIVGGVSYGERYKPSTESGIGFGSGVRVEPEVKGTSGISFEKSAPASTNNGKKSKPIFGEGAPITEYSSPQEAMRAAKAAEKQRAKEEKDAVKLAEKKHKAKLKAIAKEQSQMKKALKFNRRTPLAKALRRKLHL
jgi:hypothetical protein